MNKPDLNQYGKLSKKPKSYFPYKTKRDNIPFPVFPDPFGYGKKALAACELFKIPDGRLAGETFGSVLSPYQKRLITALFGYVDPKYGTRIFSHVLFLISRKNGKSSLAALIALLEMLSGREKDALTVIMAATVPQSRIAFNIIRALLESNANISRLCRLQDSLHKISYVSPGGDKAVIQIVASNDPAKLHGLSPSMILIDELHALKGEKGLRSFSALTSGQGARKNPRLLICTTQSDDPRALASGEIFRTIYDRALGVKAGEIKDPRFLPVIFQPGAKADWQDERLWRAVNPGISKGILSITELREEFRRAQGSPLLENAFKTLRLNMEPRNAAGGAWLEPTLIERQTRPIEWSEFHACTHVLLGADLAAVDDFTSVVAAGFKDDGSVICRGFHYVSQDSFDRHLPEDARYSELLESGDLFVSPGSAINLDGVVADVPDLWELACPDNEQPILAIDPAMAGLFTKTLEENYNAQVFNVRPGAVTMTPGIVKCEMLLDQEKLFVHPGVIPFCLTNALKVRRGEAFMISRDNPTTPRKIDAAIAVLNTLILEMSGEAVVDEDCSWWIS